MAPSVSSSNKTKTMALVESVLKAQASSHAQGKQVRTMAHQSLGIHKTAQAAQVVRPLTKEDKDSIAVKLAHIAAAKKNVAKRAF